jgi:hypothetical protein
MLRRLGSETVDVNATARTLVLSFVLALSLGGCLDDDLAPYDTFLIDEGTERDQSNGRESQVDDADAGAMKSDGGRKALDSDAAPSKSHLAAFTDGEATDLADVDVFIALERDFQGFTRWPHADLGRGPHVIPEQPGRKRTYINALPEADETEFKIGTMIVKTVEVGESPSTWQAHAMAKRGGGFNERGAYGWEYFDLRVTEDGAVTMTWRGEDPPDGESYRTAFVDSDGEEIVLEQACNDCHLSSENDAVLTPQLQLDEL